MYLLLELLSIRLEKAMVFVILRTQNVVGLDQRGATAFRSGKLATELATSAAEGRGLVGSVVVSLAELNLLGDAGGGFEFGDLVDEIHCLMFPVGIVGSLAVDGGSHLLAITGIAWCLFGRRNVGNQALGNMGWGGGRESTPSEEHSSKAAGGDKFGEERHGGWES